MKNMDYGWSMHESIVVAANYDFTLADQSWEKACEMCKQDTHCFALCSGFTIRLVLIDYELQGYEKAGGLPCCLYESWQKRDS